MAPLTKFIASLIFALLAVGEGQHLAPAGGEPPLQLATPATTALEAPAVPPARSFEFEGLSDEQLVLVEWAVDLFDHASLELPSIDFVAYEDVENCRGRAGMTLYDGPVTEVRLCGGRVGPVSDWVMVHELAHVWTTAALDEESQQAFLEVRGLDAWRQGEWHERGVEHAAEILVWGLMDRPVVPGHIDQNSCDELLAGYLTLVGERPLHGFTDACDR